MIFIAKLVVAEKPSVAMSYAKVLGATNRKDGYLEGNGYLVSWCVGHLVELAVSDATTFKLAFSQTFSFEKRKFILSPLGTALTATISRAANLRRS